VIIDSKEVRRDDHATGLPSIRQQIPRSASATSASGGSHFVPKSPRAPWTASVALTMAGDRWRTPLLVFDLRVLRLLEPRLVEHAAEQGAVLALAPERERRRIRLPASTPIAQIALFFLGERRLGADKSIPAFVNVRAAAESARGEHPQPHVVSIELDTFEAHEPAVDQHGGAQSTSVAPRVVHDRR